MLDLLNLPVGNNIRKAFNAIIMMFIATATSMFAATIISSTVSTAQEYQMLVTEYRTKGNTVETLWKQCVDQKLKGCDTIFNHDTSSNPYLLALRMVFANSYSCGSQPCMGMLIDTWNSLSVVNFLVAIAIIFSLMFITIFIKSMTIGNSVLPTIKDS